MSTKSYMAATATPCLCRTAAQKKRIAKYPPLLLHRLHLQFRRIPRATTAPTLPMATAMAQQSLLLNCARIPSDNSALALTLRLTSNETAPTASCRAQAAALPRVRQSQLHHCQAHFPPRLHKRCRTAFSNSSRQCASIALMAVKSALAAIVTSSTNSTAATATAVPATALSTLQQPIRQFTELRRRETFQR